MSADHPVSIGKDGHTFMQSGNVSWIIANEPRAILYGVYQYCQKKLGYRWVDLKEETFTKPTNTMRNSWTHEPPFARRGNVLETIYDPPYISSLIDWGTKNGLNEFFFTFFLWEDVKDHIKEELVKRDLHVTLGGHCLNYLLKKVQQQSEVAAQEANKRLKFFAENIGLQEKVIDQIIDICLEDQVVSRISLWPEDVGIDERQASDFLPTYIAFTERLKKKMNRYRPDVEIEHIAYNAGLSWSMLERNTPASAKVDTLYAYWGRDYARSIDTPYHERSFKALLDWRRETDAVGTDLTVLEYYSDHFMLTELFPPLWTRINEDLSDYKQLAVNGVLNLIVPPLSKKILNTFEEAYPWKQIQHLNNYMFARLAWGDDFSEAIKDFFSDFDDDEDYCTIVGDLEKIVSKHTKWNVPLFPARVVDVDNVPTDFEANAAIKWLQSIIDYFNKLALKATKKTVSQGNTHQRTEYLRIYFHYLKQTAECLLEEWKSRQ